VTLHIADAAVASMAMAAAGTMPGVLPQRAELVPGAEPLVRVAIATRLGDNCRDVAAAVQREVIRTLAEQAGVATRVEVTVAEVLQA
jgi:hypothetical protein